MICAFVEDFDWQDVGPKRLSILRDVYRAVTEIIVRNGAASILLSLPDTNPVVAHPLPDSCLITDGLTAIWQEEAGKLLNVHEAKRAHDSPFVGVPCERAFADGVIGRYASNSCSACLPLVGPCTLHVLADGEEWVLDRNEVNAPVTFQLARKNLACLGGKIKRPHGGSHYKVSFRGAPRPWVLDPNDDPVPDAYLNELPALCGFPIDVVRFALLHGRLPQKRSKLAHFFM
jgi:hypothetical protein